MRPLGLRPQVRHECLPAQPLDDGFDGRRVGPGAFPLRGVELEAVAVAPEGVVPGQTEQYPTLVARRVVGCEREREAERSEEHTSELQSRLHLVCRLLLEKKKKKRDV